MPVTDQTGPAKSAPDPQALSIAREMRERLHPAEIILQGSRATGEHRRDSDVDLMAVCPDEAAVRGADETLRQLLNQSQGGMCIYNTSVIGLGFSQKAFGL